MIEARGFFDYNIPEQIFENGGYDNTIKLLYNYGYRTVAINQTIESSEAIPIPFQSRPVDGCEDMKVLNRLTINVTNQEAASRLIKSPMYRKYDVIGVTPANPAAFQFIANNLDADIFCINPTYKSNYIRVRKLYNQLIEKGYHCELCYGPMITDTTLRKHTIHLSHVYHSFKRSKNVIISSGATNPLFIRGPYDIINLALIFGLSEQQAKDSITHGGRKVYINSVGRRHGKTLMLIEHIEESDKDDDSVICLDDDASIMEVDGPAPKKIKQ